MRQVLCSLFYSILFSYTIISQIRSSVKAFYFITCPGKIQDESAAATAKSLQSCPTLCDPIDGSPSGSPVPGILQARTLEWVAICFSNAWKWKVEVKSRSLIRLFATPWTVAYQAPPSMGFSKQECWSGVPLPSPTYYDSIMNAYLSIQLSILLMDALPSCGRLWVVHLPVA